MSQNRHYHIWTPERSLCDLHAREEGSPAMEGEVVHVCGPCLLVAEYIQGYPWHLVQASGKPDLSPDAAIDVLRDTRWSKVINLDHYADDLATTGYNYPHKEEEES